LAQANKPICCDQQGCGKGLAEATSLARRLCWWRAGERIAPALSVAGDTPVHTGTFGGFVICDTPVACPNLFKTALTTREFQNCYSEHLVSGHLVSH
jgi:hypothetical protein